MYNYTDRLKLEIKFFPEITSGYYTAYKTKIAFSTFSRATIFTPACAATIVIIHT